MKKTLLLLVGFVLAARLALTQAPPPILKQISGGPGKPLSPQEARKLFKIDDGLRIDLVACEPQIESPVAMQFAPDGRLWVVEMRDYPNGPGRGEKPAGRIRILDDKDGDGFFETSTIWADNLLFANGLLLWKDGAIVTMAPSIQHLRDTDGDGRAETREVLYTGFADQNPQLRVSHPNLGLDGWVYCANGLRGGKATAYDPMGKQHPVVDLSGLDFRFDPVHRLRYEAITGPGQYGNTFDEWGNRFVCDNRHHLRHIVMENRYLKRNPYLAAPALVEDISVLEDGPLSSGGKIYPLSKNWTTSSLHEGRFTAACGVFIYHGHLLDTGARQSRDRKGAGNPGDAKPPLPDGRGSDRGSSYRGAAFTCDPTGNLVHMEILTPKGATFEARPHKKGVEFLASPDDWFRPVFLTHGPEGALYVVDMYRAVIEHPEFMPPELKNRPDLWQGKDKGRIWRIVPKDHVTKTPRPDLVKASIAELVKTLEHEEPWWRGTAQRLLLEKDDKAMIEPLTKLLETTKSPHAKIVAAWLLERQGTLREDDLWTLLVDKHPRVREHAVRLAEPLLEKNKDLRNCGVGQMAGDRDARVRFQAALALGAFKERAGELGDIAWQSREDRWTRLAVLTAIPSLAPKVLCEFVDGLGKSERQDKAALAMTRELAILTAASESPNGYWNDLQETSNLTGGLELSCFAGLAEGMERRGKTLVTSAVDVRKEWQEPYRKRVDAILAQASQHLRDAKQPLDLRLTCLRLMGHASWATAKTALTPLVTEEASLELRIAALRTLASRQENEVPTFLMKLWPGAPPSLRREILEAMLRQPARAQVLLDEIEAKRLKASELDPLRTRQLMSHANPALRERAQKLLAANLPADRQKILAEYQAALKFEGDAKAGLEIFKKTCATCHRVAGVGIDVGPDIADTRTKTRDALLNDIIAPNAAIDANYVNYVVNTKGGRSLTGILTAETASSVTLKRAEGQSDVVLRTDIEEIASTGVSLMPEALEKNISVREMADLLSFLKNWRYLDGSVPTGK